MSTVYLGKFDILAYLKALECVVSCHFCAATSPALRSTGSTCPLMLTIRCTKLSKVCKYPPGTEVNIVYRHLKVPFKTHATSDCYYWAKCLRSGFRSNWPSSSTGSLVHSRQYSRRMPKCLSTILDGDSG